MNENMNEHNEYKNRCLEFCDLIVPILQCLQIDPFQLKSWIKNQDFATWNSWEKEVFATLLDLNPLAIRWLIEEMTWTGPFSNFDSSSLIQPIRLDRDIPQQDYPDSISTCELRRLRQYDKNGNYFLYGNESIFVEAIKPEDLDENDLPQLRPHGLSLDQLYRKRKNSLSSETLRSNMMRDQLLVAYVIREAQRGKKEAVNILLRCYEDMISRMATEFYKRHQGMFDIIIELDDVKDLAKILCSKRIVGDNKKHLHHSLMIPQTEKVRRRFEKFKDECDPRLWEELSQIAESPFQTESHNITEWLNILNKRTRKLFDKYTGTFSAKKDLNRLGIQHFNIYIIRKASLLKLMNGEPHQKVLEIWALAESLCLNTFWSAMKDPEFNKKRFAPEYGKPPYHRNLTTFLFGKSRTHKGVFVVDPKCALWQDLSDWSKHKPIKRQNHISLDEEIFESRDITYHDTVADPSMGNLSDALENQETIEAWRNLLTDQQLSIYIKYEVDKMTQKEIAIEHGISQPTVYRRLQEAHRKIDEAKKQNLL